MRVLVACEYSGRVRDAFIAAGHIAVSCDLLPTEAPGPHWQGDVRELLGPGFGWDLLVAHPPCTYLAASGMHWTTRGLRDPRFTDEAVAFARLLLDAPIPRVCVENPVGVLSRLVRPPDQIVQPHWFGDDASKRTCLWLRGLPPLRPTEMVEPRIVDGRPRWGNQTNSGQNRLSPSPDRWKARSVTYPGLAAAMAAQWG